MLAWTTGPNNAYLTKPIKPAWDSSREGDLGPGTLLTWSPRETGEHRVTLTAGTGGLEFHRQPFENFSEGNDVGWQCHPRRGRSTATRSAMGGNIQSS